MTSLTRSPQRHRDGVGLGTETRIVVTDPAVLDEAAAFLQDRIADLDRAASRFRTDSELSWANRHPGSPVRVGPTLRDAMAESLAMAAATDGLVDPAVGADVVAAGYDRSFELLPVPPAQPDGSVPSRAPTYTVTEVPVEPGPTWRDVVLTEDPEDSKDSEGREGAWLTVPWGSSLDLGAVAKAWLADTVAVQIALRWGCGVLVELGGDIAVAGVPPMSGWIIGLPRAERADPEHVAIWTGGIATSAQDRRRWQTSDGPAHHIIDPRTRRPAASPWRAVTVHAATASEANAAATAALILGESAPEWLARRGLAARLLPLDGGDPRRVGPWPNPGLTSGEVSSL